VSRRAFFRRGDHRGDTAAPAGLGYYRLDARGQCSTAVGANSATAPSRRIRRSGLGGGRRSDRGRIGQQRTGRGACGRSGLPLLAIFPLGHNRLIPFRLLKTSDTDRTPLYGRPFLCKACGSREVTLFSIDDQAELAAISAAPRAEAAHHGANVARADGPECRAAVGRHDFPRTAPSPSAAGRWSRRHRSSAACSRSSR
jgi:hypothetical protein